MNQPQLFNTHIKSFRILPSPNELKRDLPAVDASINTVAEGRRQIEDILSGRDSRFLVIVGPCSIHDVSSALDYAQRLKLLAEKLKERALIVMRVYFEKPRTTVGWKGLINDPDLNGSFAIDKGIRIARQLLCQIAELGLPVGTEALDPISPQYLSDLVSWSAIGARTIESQTHREMASGLSMPVGLKNGTDGNIQVAVDALRACSAPHNFLGIDGDGRVSIFQTTGNPYGHIILRGGGGKPNYDGVTLANLESALSNQKLPTNLIVDCSHGNSNKDFRRQPAVFRELLALRREGHAGIVGAMLESNIFEGNQSIPSDLSQLRYGVSVTDGCISWEATEHLLSEIPLG